MKDNRLTERGIYVAKEASKNGQNPKRICDRGGPGYFFILSLDRWQRNKAPGVKR